MLWYAIVLLPMLVKMLPTDIDRHDQTISSSAVSLLDEESRHRQEAERDEPGMELHIDHDWSLTLPRLLEFGGRDPLSQDMSCQALSGEVVLYCWCRPGLSKDNTLSNSHHHSTLHKRL